MMEFYGPQGSGGQKKFKLLHRDGEGLPSMQKICIYVFCLMSGGSVCYWKLAW